jgi:hypothetical protein
VKRKSNQEKAAPKSHPSIELALSLGCHQYYAGFTLSTLHLVMLVLPLLSVVATE